MFLAFSTWSAECAADRSRSLLSDSLLSSQESLTMIKQKIFVLFALSAHWQYLQKTSVLQKKGWNKIKISTKYLFLWYYQWLMSTVYKNMLRRLSDNRLLLRSAAHSAGHVEKAKNILNIVITMLPVFSSFSPCLRNVRSISRRSHSRTVSWLNIKYYILET